MQPSQHGPTDYRPLWAVIAVATIARLATLGTYPILNPTESRYAEIARKMAELGDWVTPWFDYSQPFWGKPPLSFWMTAASFNLLGVNAFAARLPHWLFGALVAWLVWNWAARRSRREAIYATALLTGSIAFFVAAGAVMTDMALVLGTTLAMRGFWLALHGEPASRHREQCALFLGGAIGLLAKGPVAIVLIGVPIAAWALAFGELRRALRDISWVYGLLLIGVLVVPWYAWAEFRTPGFLEYFLIGEHWQRFTTPGWAGDLYGQGHHAPRGTIWLLALAACLPWSLLVPLLAWRWGRTAVSPRAEDRKLTAYLLLWSVFPCVFFTFAGNVVWTYVLPGLPALAIATALWLDRLPRHLPVGRVVAGGVVCTALAVMGAVVGLTTGGLGVGRSSQALVADYATDRRQDEALVFVGKRPLSASFYSRGRAGQVCCADELIKRLDRDPIYVAAADTDFQTLPSVVRKRLQFVSRRGQYLLFHSTPGDAALQYPDTPP